MGRICWTWSLTDAGADLVIEAVIEDDAIKAIVIKEVEPLMAPKGIFASNTCYLNTHLAKASERPSQFIGLHFFSRRADASLGDHHGPRDRSRRLGPMLGLRSSDR